LKQEERFSQMNYTETENKIADVLAQKLDETGMNGYIVGISGGIDSAVTATLAVKAAGPEKVTGLITPGESSKDENMEDAVQLAEELGIEYYEIDIEPAVESIKSQAPVEVGEVSTGNIRARTRMIYEYLAANEEDKLVLGTGNRTELLLGYFTKHGDGAADLLPIADLYKTEVKELAEYLGLDQKFIEKPPTAGLWEGQSDEDELGASYDTIDLILRQLIDEEKSVENVAEEIEVEKSEVERFKSMYEKSEHKRNMPDSPGLR
jgi:NAD+ synthase